jgi:glycosyltransferase involved in cell wall biosynthesis
MVVADDARGDTPLVSVWVISYNQEAYIEEALQSALDQNYPNLEVVVSDDASTDATPALIAAMAQRHPGKLVPILNAVNGGITANSNIALRQCRGKYIAFMGGDDVLLPGKIAAQVAWMEADADRALCGHQVEVFYEDGTQSHPLTRHLPEGRGAEHVLCSDTFGATAVMVRADRLPAYGFDERLPSVSDYMLYIDVLAQGGTYGFVPGTLARYRKHSSNITNNLAKLTGDLSTYFDIVDERYPQFARLTRRGRVRRTMYDLGVFYLRGGRKADARREFLRAIRSEPTFLKAWIRLGQTVM